jgi:predicted dehydrogenase
VNLTPEQEALGRRNFLKALAGTPALAALGASLATRGPIRGGPVRVAWLGVGSQGRALLSRMDPAYTEVRAFCDINPTSLAKADELLAKAKLPPARHYSDWKEMLAKEDIEGVVMAPPLWMHADLAVGCMEAGKHVLCEKMMAWDVPSCQRMMDAAHKTGKVLEIGYQRNYNPVYQATYEGIIKAGVLGDVYHARLAWHRNGNWRRAGEPPSKDYDPSPWGYPDFEHLLNWRLYWRYSKGLLAELASHQVNITNWFFGSTPEYVQGYGGVLRFKDGREVQDHVYATFEYPDGRTAVFSAIESNAFDNYYEMFMGTKGTLILRAETDAMLFPEGNAAHATAVESAAKTPGGAALDASESKPASQTSTAVGGSAPGSAAGENVERGIASRNEIARWAAAIRTGAPLLCGPERASHSARACIVANEALQKNERVKV